MRILKYFCIVLVVFTALHCERDDICAETTTTTPMLIVKFINFETGTTTKKPVELQVKAFDVKDAFLLNEVKDSILIPLKTDEAITNYEFIINSDTSNDTIPANTDTISIQYTPVEEYISSACGFKVNYEGLTVSPPSSEDSDKWIKNITIQRQNVTDETSAHIYIFH